MLGDGDGVELGLQFQAQPPQTQVIIMTGGQISAEEQAICRERDIPILQKPFLGDDVLTLVRGRLIKDFSTCLQGEARLRSVARYNDKLMLYHIHID